MNFNSLVLLCVLINYLINSFPVSKSTHSYQVNSPRYAIANFKSFLNKQRVAFFLTKEVLVEYSEPLLAWL